MLKDRRNELFSNNRNVDDADLSNGKLDGSAPILQQHISVAAEAANMGFWFRDFDRDDFWASEEWRALFGFTNSEPLDVEKFFQRLHPILI